MAAQKLNCILCNQKAIVNYDIKTDYTFYNCPNCGIFNDENSGVNNLSPEEKALISYVIHRRFFGNRITTPLTEELVREILAKEKLPTIPQKVENFISTLGAQSAKLGHCFTNFPYATIQAKIGAVDEDEVFSVAAYALKSGLLNDGPRIRRDSSGEMNVSLAPLELSVEGLERYREIISSSKQQEESIPKQAAPTPKFETSMTTEKLQCAFCQHEGKQHFLWGAEPIHDNIPNSKGTAYENDSIIKFEKVIKCASCEKINIFSGMLHEGMGDRFPTWENITPILQLRMKDERSKVQNLHETQTQLLSLQSIDYLIDPNKITPFLSSPKYTRVAQLLLEINIGYIMGSFQTVQLLTKSLLNLDEVLLGKSIDNATSSDKKIFINLKLIKSSADLHTHDRGNLEFPANDSQLPEKIALDIFLQRAIQNLFH